MAFIFLHRVLHRLVTEYFTGYFTGYSTSHLPSYCAITLQPIWSIRFLWLGHPLRRIFSRIPTTLTLLSALPCVSKLQHDTRRCDVIIVRRCHHCSSRCRHLMSSLFIAMSSFDVIIVRRQLIYMFIAVSYGIALSGWPRSISVHAPALVSRSQTVLLLICASTCVVLGRVLIRLYQLYVHRPCVFPVSIVSVRYHGAC